MKTTKILGTLALSLATASPTFAALTTVLVTPTNSIVIPYIGFYGKSDKITLGGSSLVWQQTEKSGNIVATLPSNLAPGTYRLKLAGQDPIDLAIGLQGPQGVAGATGAQGPQGDTGAVGPQGPVGPVGPAGAVGPQGLTGASGAAGSQGPQGPVGPKGGLVSNFIFAYATGGQQQLAANSSVQFTMIGAESGTAWTTNGASFVIPANGVYQISFMINSDVSIHQPEQIAMQITDTQGTTNALPLGYFTFLTQGACSGQVIANCAQGDSISIDNASIAFAFGRYIPTNAPCATISIMQIQ